VETRGALTRGQSVGWLSGIRERTEDRGDHDDVVEIEPTVGTIDVALEVDTESFLEFFLSRLGLNED